MSTSFNILSIITYVTILCGIIWLADSLFFAAKRRALYGPETATKDIKKPLLVDYARSFFPWLFIVLLIRAFVLQIYTVPTGSLEPTIIPGDDLIATMYNYGLHLPIIHTKIFATGSPQHGDIMLFRDPSNPKITLIKRVIGVPGDHISYINKILYINGKKQPQKFIADSKAISQHGKTWHVVKMQEDLDGVKHDIFLNPAIPTQNFKDLLVPKNDYFAMGDNRDDSLDSRYWGFAPSSSIIAKANVIVFSWNKFSHSVRWQRIGELL